MTCAKTFGNSLLCHMYARRLVEVPNAPTPTLFANVDFTFADARALVRDAPPDAHAPFYTRANLSLTARLWTNGWDLYVPSRVPLVRCYVDRPREMWMEDRRSGAALYGGSNLTVGSVVECEEREFLNLISRRRVLQLVGAPDENSETSREEPIVFTETYGAGDARSVESFIERVGVDFRAKTVAPRERRWNARARLLQFARFAPDELARWFIVLDRVRSERTRVLVLARAVRRATARVRTSLGERFVEHRHARPPTLPRRVFVVTESSLNILRFYLFWTRKRVPRALEREHLDARRASLR